MNSTGGEEGRAGLRRMLRRVHCRWNESSPECSAAAATLLGRFRENGFEVIDGPDEEVSARSEVLVILGGDGFLMESLRRLAYPATPIFGVNFGSVGFLMNPRRELDSLPETLSGSSFAAEEHAVLEARVSFEDGRSTRVLAFNEFVLERASQQSIRLEVSLDGVPFNRYAGDGFIIATAAGSTAYNLAAGGPVVHPALRALVVTPLYPHRASPFHSMQFSLCLPLSSRVTVVPVDLPKRGMRVVGDGESLERASSVTVADSGRVVTLLRPRNHSFAGTLSRKVIGE